jgi:multiple sugar transport system substrate-binding protein
MFSRNETKEATRRTTLPTQASKSLSRRALLKWIGAGSATLALAACAPVAPQAGPTGDDSAPGPEGAPAQTEIKVLVCCYAPPDLEVRNQVNADFAAAHPGVVLNQELLPAGQNYFEKLQTLIAAGTAPDIFDMWEGYVQPYAANGALLNLDPFLETDSRVKKDGLLPAAIDGGSWEDHLYALLIGFIPGPVSLYYNAAHFEQAGAPAPTADWTWDDMRSAAQALTVDSNGDGTPEQWGVAFDLWFVPWLHWIWSNGGDVLNTGSTAATIAEAPSVEALQWWADLVNVDKLALAPSMLASMQGALNAFQTGAVSMLLGNAWDVGTLTGAQDLQWQAVLSPTANNGNRVWYTHFQCWAISAQTQVGPVAWEYIRDFVFAYEPAVQAIAPTIPGIAELLPVFDNETTRNLGYQPLLDLVTQPGVMRIPGGGAKWDKISGLIQAELDLVFAGEKSAADAAATVSPQVDEELARQ